MHFFLTLESFHLKFSILKRNFHNFFSSTKQLKHVLTWWELLVVCDGWKFPRFSMLIENYWTCAVGVLDMERIGSSTTEKKLIVSTCVIKLSLFTSDSVAVGGKFQGKSLSFCIFDLLVLFQKQHVESLKNWV